MAKKVLFPRVYLANGDREKYKHKGAVIAAAESLRLSATGDIYSSGTLVSGKDLTITANALNNNGGDITAGTKTNITTTNDLTNQNGGNIKGQSVALTSTDGDIINKTNVRTIGSDDNIFSTTSEKSSITSTVGNTVLSAFKNIFNSGADIQAEGDIALTAQTGDVSINTVKTDNKRILLAVRRHQKSANPYEVNTALLPRDICHRVRVLMPVAKQYGRRKNQLSPLPIAWLISPKKC